MHFGKFTPWTAWHDVLDGTEHYEFRFPNGYGASVPITESARMAQKAQKAQK